MCLSAGANLKFRKGKVPSSLAKIVKLIISTKKMSLILVVNSSFTYEFLVARDEGTFSKF